MYTLGTSAVKYLQDKITDTAIKAALEGKIVAYVGTEYDRTDNTPVYRPPAASPVAVFFQLPAVGNTTPENMHTMAPITVSTTADIFVVDNFQWNPTKVGTIDYHFVVEYLIPASSLNNVVYQFQRGNEADIGSAVAKPGVPYYAKDKEDLYIYDGVKWVRVSAGGIFLGAIIEYPEQLSLPPNMATQWLRCNGATLTQQQITDYPDFATLIHDKFGNGYVLPFQNNAIIRIED